MDSPDTKSNTHFVVPWFIDWVHNTCLLLSRRRQLTYFQSFAPAHVRNVAGSTSQPRTKMHRSPQLGLQGNGWYELMNAFAKFLTKSMIRGRIISRHPTEAHSNSTMSHKEDFPSSDPSNIKQDAGNYRTHVLPFYP